MSPWYPPRVCARRAEVADSARGRSRDAQDLVDLLEREVLVGLARGDDQVGRQLHLAEQVLVLQRDVELVVHALSPQLPGTLAPALPPKHVPSKDEPKPSDPGTRRGGARSSGPV